MIKNIYIVSHSNPNLSTSAPYILKRTISCSRCHVEDSGALVFMDDNGPLPEIVEAFAHGTWVHVQREQKEPD